MCIVSYCAYLCTISNTTVLMLPLMCLGDNWPINLTTVGPYIDF